MKGDFTISLYFSSSVFSGAFGKRMLVLCYATLILVLSMLHNIISWPKNASLEESKPAAFRVAVYEHVLQDVITVNTEIVSRVTALTIMRKNLAVFSEQTSLARRLATKIIVFPEYGLYGFSFTRKSVYPYLEEIPDPELVQWSPCSDPDRFPNTEVQAALSCMAQSNEIYLVANMGDRVPCNSATDPQCPPDGRYQYNTDVAYGPDGRLLAKYHKTNLYYEHFFDKAESKLVFFDSPFGRVGMLVCYDLLFKDPAVTMVTEHNVSIIAFPTAWKDALPFLSAVGYHSSFARGLGVNLLAANLHSPLQRLQGSGIYTPQGVASFAYDSDPLSPGELLVSTIYDMSKPLVKISNYDDNSTPIKLLKRAQTEEFIARLYKNQFNFVLLDAPSGELDVCQNNVCCSLSYSYEDFPNRLDLFAFGAFDGFHDHGNQYFQICSLVKCAGNDDKHSCGSPTKLSSTKFKSLTMFGNFQSEFIYPQVILTSSGQLVPADPASWSFHNRTLQALGQGMDMPLLSATLFSRHYTKDIKEDNNNNDTNCQKSENDHDTSTASSKMNSFENQHALF